MSLVQLDHKYDAAFKVQCISTSPQTYTPCFPLKDLHLQMDLFGVYLLTQTHYYVLHICYEISLPNTDITKIK